MFDKPHTIWSNQGESRFNYDATEKLVKRTDKKAGGDMVTYYVGGHEAIYQADGSSEIKRYIRDIAIHSIKNNGNQSLHYVFNDHLGSGSVITDANGNVVETASFDAFGKRRNANSWQGYANPFSQLPNLTALLNITQKGYTGHIQVDHAAVIHMGGRIYDPELGRFMQADPIVQDPRDAQSLNRYSYVYNNPLSYTDPTGYECQNRNNRDCFSAIEQANKDAAKAAQTQGSSKPEEVSKGNQSADLQKSAKAANGQTQSQNQSSGLQEDIKRQAEQGMRSAVNDASVTETNEGSVNAKWGEVVRDEQGNPTQIGVSCDITCRKNAADYSKFTSDDIAMSVMRTSYLNSQRNVAQSFYQVAEKSSYVFLATEMAAYSVARWAFMSASEKVAYFSLFGSPVTLANGGMAGVAVDDASVWLYQSVRSLRPHMKAPAGAGKPVVRSDGKGGYYVE